jgi:hypothetical protein
MISYDDWKAIWEKSEMLALADKVIKSRFPSFLLNAVD